MNSQQATDTAQSIAIIILALAVAILVWRDLRYQRRNGHLPKR